MDFRHREALAHACSRELILVLEAELLGEVDFAGHCFQHIFLSQLQVVSLGREVQKGNAYFSSFQAHLNLFVCLHSRVQLRVGDIDVVDFLPLSHYETAGLFARGAMLVLVLLIEVAFDVIHASQVFCLYYATFVLSTLLVDQLEAVVTSKASFIDTLRAAEDAIVLLVHALVIHFNKRLFTLLALLLVEVVALDAELHLFQTLIEVLERDFDCVYEGVQALGSLVLLLRTVQANLIDWIEVLAGGSDAVAKRVVFSFNRIAVVQEHAYVVRIDVIRRALYAISLDVIRFAVIDLQNTFVLH